jgi:hypothetical protein
LLRYDKLLLQILPKYEIGKVISWSAMRMVGAIDTKLISFINPGDDCFLIAEIILVLLCLLHDCLSVAEPVSEETILT